MEWIRDLYKSLISIYSEIIWLYYTIVMFASVEYNYPAFFDITWLAIAAPAGYILNTVLARINNHTLLYVGNISVLTLLIIKNWQTAVLPGLWGLGIAISLGISFIFLRSLFLVRQSPKRQEILKRFEWNILFYTFFAVIFTYNKWSNEIFHIVFIFAIAGSLMGMLMSLEGYEDASDNEKIKIVKVGQSGWFAGFMTLLLICIPVFSLALLLPSVNNALYALAINVWETLKWAGSLILRLLTWLFSLFPVPEEEYLPDPIQGQIPINEYMEQANITLPYIWIIVTVAILLIILTLWFLTKFFKSYRLPKTKKPRKVSVIGESWWVKLIKSLRVILKSLKMKWFMHFPYFYHKPVYWYYHQVVIWGERNKVPKLKSETSREYINKLTAKIPETAGSIHWNGQTYCLAEIIQRLNDDYQAAYYGLKTDLTGEAEYRLLIRHLKSLCLDNVTFPKKTDFLESFWRI